MIEGRCGHCNRVTDTVPCPHCTVTYRCPTCGAEGQFPTGLPGGPALCEHPSSAYLIVDRPEAMYVRLERETWDELAFNANVALPEAQERFKRAEAEVERLRGQVLRYESTGAVRAVVEPLEAEIGRLREALHSIAHTAIFDAQNLRDIAADALVRKAGPDG